MIYDFRNVKSTNAKRDNSAARKSQVRVSKTTRVAQNEGRN